MVGFQATAQSQPVLRLSIQHNPTEFQLQHEVGRLAERPGSSLKAT